MTGEPAAVVLRSAGLPPGGQVALRRSALRVDGAGTLAGRVVSARATPEATRLVVLVTGVGELAAVAAPGVPAPGPGEEVRLAVDGSRLAVIPFG
jgi:thiamine transport system ATP-binding protein